MLNKLLVVYFGSLLSLKCLSVKLTTNVNKAEGTLPKLFRVEFAIAEIGSYTLSVAF